MGGGPGGGRMGWPEPDGSAPPRDAPDRTEATSTLRGGLQLGPPGRWWDDKHFAKDLKLRADQQHKMDSIFEDHRADLLRHFETLEDEQNKLETLTRAKVLDEPALMAEIDRVAQARAELEKANTRYLIEIRNQMDPDQVTRLESHR